jgi:UDP-glucose 4-epimerase
MPYIAKVASGKLPYLNIFGKDYSTKDGTGIRDYIHIMDLVDGHLVALEYLRAHPNYEIVNLGTGVGYSVMEIVSEFEAAWNLKIPYKFSCRRSGDIASCIADVSRAEEIFRWTAQRGLSSMCSSVRLN